MALLLVAFLVSHSNTNYVYTKQEPSARGLINESESRKRCSYDLADFWVGDKNESRRRVLMVMSIAGDAVPGKSSLMPAPTAC